MNLSPSLRKSLAGILSVFWILAVILGYASTHKPFSPSQAVILFRAVWQVLLLVFFFSLAGGIGARLMPRFSGYASALSFFLQGALGLGILGLAIFFLGLAGFFRPMIFAAGMILAAFVFFPDVRRWWASWKEAFSLLGEMGKFDAALLAGIAFLLTTSFLTSLAPPVAFDSLVYHFTLPKAYLQMGRIAYLPQLMFWGMPQQIEMLYTAAMALGGVEAAAVLGWGIGVFALMGLWAFLASSFRPRVAWTAAAALFAGYTLPASLSWGYVDWATFLWGTAGFLSFVFWQDTRERKFLILLGLFSGFALGTKYTAALLLLFAVTAVLADGIRQKTEKGTLSKEIGLLLLVAGITVFPWLVKNWVWTGNPVYPLLFPSGAMDRWRLRYYDAPAWGNWMDVFLLPLRATIWGVEGKVGYSASIGALLLGFSAASWVFWKERSPRQRRILSYAAGFVFLSLFVWAVAGRSSMLLLQTRLYLVFFPAWAILAGAGFDALSRLETEAIRFGFILSALFLFSFGLNLYETESAFVTRGVPSYLFGRISAESYRQRTTGAYEEALSWMEELPADSSVLMLWETRSFSCFPQCEPDETIDRWYDAVHRYNTSEDILDSWREEGYDYLLVARWGAEFIREHDDRISSENWAALESLLSQLPLVEESPGAYELYRLTP